MSITTSEPTLVCRIQEEPQSTLIQPEFSLKCQKQNPRPKNIRLFTGLKSQQIQSFKNSSENLSCENKKEISDSFRAPPLLKQSSKVKPLLRDIQSNYDQSNIDSSTSTDETLSKITPITQDDIGESCSSDEISKIDIHDILETKIHKWLDDEHIYITDPREKKDQYYQKLKSISYKLSQIQSSVQYQNDEDSIETFDSSLNLTGLTQSTIPINTICDFQHLNFKIENSPLLMRRSSNTTNKTSKIEQDQSIKFSHTQVLIASPSKNYKKTSIFKSSDQMKINLSKKDINIVPFPEDELEEGEKKTSLSIQEMSSILFDFQEVPSLTCENTLGTGFQ